MRPNSGHGLLSAVFLAPETAKSTADASQVCTSACPPHGDWLALFNELGAGLDIALSAST